MSLVTPIHGACPERSEWVQDRLRGGISLKNSLALKRCNIIPFSALQKDTISTPFKLQ